MAQLDDQVEGGCAPVPLAMVSCIGGVIRLGASGDPGGATRMVGPAPQPSKDPTRIVVVRMSFVSSVPSTTPRSGLHLLRAAWGPPEPISSGSLKAIDLERDRNHAPLPKGEGDCLRLLVCHLPHGDDLQYRIPLRSAPASCALLLLAGLSFASSPLPRAAVYPLTQIGTDSSSAQVITEALGMEVLRTGNARVMERSQIQSILAEQGFTKSGVCDASECAVEIGRILGVDRMVVGSLGKVEDVVVLHARLIDITTGEVLAVASRQTRNTVAGLLEKDVAAVARELFPRPQQTLLPPTAAAPPSANASATNTQTALEVPWSRVPWKRFLPDELQAALDLSLMPTTDEKYRGVGVGVRLRTWWHTPFRPLAVAPGFVYTDRLERHGYEVFALGPSGSLRLQMILNQALLLEARLEQSYTRVMFEKDDPVVVTYPYGSEYPWAWQHTPLEDRWEPMTALTLGIRHHTKLPVDVAASYGPALFDGTLIHRFELSTLYPIP